MVSRLLHDLKSKTFRFMSLNCGRCVKNFQSHHAVSDRGQQEICDKPVLIFFDQFQHSQHIYIHVVMHNSVTQPYCSIPRGEVSKGIGSQCVG
jgi:hypothetical protein